MDLLKEKAQRAKEDFQKDNVMEIQKKVSNAKNVSLEAINKEWLLEKQIMEEEKMRQRQEEVEIESQIKAEEEKRKSLQTAIMEKELENQFNVEKVESEDEITDIQKKAQEEIQKNREELVKKITMSKNDHKRKIRKLKKRARSVREQMAGELSKFASTNGNMNNCYIGTIEKEKDMNIYCLSKYADDPEGLMECKTIEYFCESCCDAEFSDNSGMVKNCKAKKCTVPMEQSNDTGRWTWKTNNMMALQ